MYWINEKNGYLTDWVTQQWVCTTGKQVDLAVVPWLSGPIGNTNRIGTDFFRNFAHTHGLELRTGVAGIVPDFSRLDWEGFSVQQVSSAVRHFYEHTAVYEMDAWSQWNGLFRLFGGLLASMFSRRLQQLNVPLSGLDTSQGMTSEILQLVDTASERVHYIAWVRQLVGSGHTLYAGTYSVCQVPKYPGPCVKVTFPLPNGNAIVIMKPTVHQDGSVTLTSSGLSFGDAGFYFTVYRNDRVYVRYVRPLRETIHVYSNAQDEVRADHEMTLWMRTFLRLHYRLSLKEAV
ncbi:MAG: hypothetical protein K8L99_30965 [Anaerolineae bacterium]|nr:hypothetical protein [Anaerolineae bacterium]